jgi:hypothetical protein
MDERSAPTELLSGFDRGTLIFWRAWNMLWWPAIAALFAGLIRFDVEAVLELTNLAQVIGRHLWLDLAVAIIAGSAVGAVMGTIIGARVHRAPMVLTIVASLAYGGLALFGGAPIHLSPIARIGPLVVIELVAIGAALILPGALVSARISWRRRPRRVARRDPKPRQGMTSHPG